MTEEMTEWIHDLYKLFEKEVRLYKELLEIEISKTDAINKIEGKLLETLTKKSYELSITASILEKARMDAINDIYKKNHMEKPQSVTLSDFLNNIDRKSNYKLKGITNSLKETVHNLKSRIIVNEKLVKSRQELFQFTINSIQEAASENEVYSATGKKSKSKPVMLNMQV